MATSAVLSLLKKDLILEYRLKETVILSICLSVLLAFIAAFSVSSSFLTSATVVRLYPGFLWLVFLFAATVSIGRSFEYEQRERAIEGLLLTGIAPPWIYLSKGVSNLIVISISHLISMVLLAVLLGVSLAPILFPLVILSAIVLFGYASLATLLAALTSTARLKTMLLPLVLLPLLFPLFLGAVELTSELLATGSMPLDSLWISILVGLDVIYLLLGINLFEYTVRP